MANERIPGPLGATDTSGAVSASSAPSGTTDAPAVPTIDEFRELVLAAAIADRQRQGRTHFPAVPDSELATVEGQHRMRSVPAAALIRLLAAARSQLRSDQTGPPASSEQERQQNLARSVASIGVGSAYRDYNREATIWRNLFPQYYQETQAARNRADGGHHGPAAVQILVRYYSSRKAPPGFSNHSDGRAVDFTTRQGGTLYTADTHQRAGWRTTWLHQWLVVNATTYGFHPLASEEWHWDHR